MFREMRRSKQQISESECAELLKAEKRGVLSLIGDGGYPYGIPIDHFYCEENGRLYFHCAKEGHKIDALTACDKASYCVTDDGYRKDGEWALNIKSVIVFGRISPVGDNEKTLEMCRRLAEKFTDDTDCINDEIERCKDRVMCLELVPEHITGKLVKES